MVIFFFVFSFSFPHHERDSEKFPDQQQSIINIIINIKNNNSSSSSRVVQDIKGESGTTTTWGGRKCADRGGLLEQVLSREASTLVTTAEEGDDGKGGKLAYLVEFPTK